MGPRAVLIACFATLAVACLTAIGVGISLIRSAVPEAYDRLADLLLLYGGGAAFALTTIVALAGAYLDLTIAQPLLRLVRGIQTVLFANPDHRIDVGETQHLGGLPDAVKEVVTQLANARSRVNDAITDATDRIEQQKKQLETILHDLHDGVIICNLNHEILLYNIRAHELLRVVGQLGLARSLFSFVSRQPIVHAIGRLTNRLASGQQENHPEGLSAPFVCATADGRHTLEGRMSLMLGPDASPSGYVITFRDNTEKLAALGLRDRLLRDATEGLRGVVGNLRAAAEILISHPQMPVAEQEAFKQVMIKEANQLSDRVEGLAKRYRDVITSHWPTSDIYSPNLFNSLLRRIGEQKGLTAMMTGIPQWLHGDSYTLVELLDRLIHRLRHHAAVDSIDLEASGGERHVYLDVVWRGAPIPGAELDSWLTERLEETYGGLSLREVLDHHKTDVWCLPAHEGRARLRLPLPPAAQPLGTRDGLRTAPRPEFYDFDLIKQAQQPTEIGASLLKSLTYVVFDTETTGLRPSAGDEIIAIAGVRVVNGRILTGESFERVVNPKRDIPRDSIRIHGITAEMVKDKPPVQLVLPQFRAFVGDAVLVAHNAAFDLKFLKLKEGEVGVAFDMPVLDTLLLSVLLHDYAGDHNLESVAERFGISVRGRHTAIGDALVTAGVFLRMIDLLEARGIRTLNEAIEAGNSIVEVRRKQAEF
jgi:DNA polymerase-3 subunit epsilon